MPKKPQIPKSRKKPSVRSRKPPIHPEPTPKDEWSIAERMLETYASTLFFVNQPEVRKKDILAMLRAMDGLGTVQNLINLSDIEKTPDEDIHTLVDLYTAALVTDMARKTGHLDHFKRINLISFQTEEERRQAVEHEPGGYRPEIPSIEALLGEIPGMNQNYLDILKGRLEAAMARHNILSPGQRKPDNPNACASAFYEAIGFEGFYEETKAAFVDYLVGTTGPDQEEIAKRLAKKSVVFLFMWHIPLDHINEIVSELVGGPVMPLRPGICPDCSTELAQKMLRLKRKTKGKR